MKVNDDFVIHGIISSFLDILTGYQLMYNESTSSSYVWRKYQLKTEKVKLK